MPSKELMLIAIVKNNKNAVRLEVPDGQKIVGRGLAEAAIARRVCAPRGVFRHLRPRPHPCACPVPLSETGLDTLFGHQTLLR
jgi:hypothetical protein